LTFTGKTATASYMVFFQKMLLVLNQICFVFSS